ncbi:MAG: pyridoxal phosphate-dependent class II aminotransferase [Lachnospiraceae bacterium]|nr:pyridoxal phosphate-dependent class II aminotransferase [Lachnospiraceae bacterium]
MKTQQHGGDVYRHKNVIDFSANMNPLGTPERVIGAAAESLRDIEHYPDIFCTELREGLGQVEGVNPEFIFCGNGAAEVIFSLVLALKPKRALLTAPTFLEYEQALRVVDCTIDYVNLKAEHGFAVQESILDSITKDLDIMFLCNPNNPTGVLIPKDMLKKILKKCEEQQVLLVLDECFNDFIREPERYTMKEYLTKTPWLFLLKAFTKRYAMAGIRLGYGITSNLPLLGRMQDVTQPWNVSIPAQAAGVAALQETEYVKRGMEIVHEERAYLKQELQNLGYLVFDSEANYIFFCGPKDLYEKALAAGFLIRDCGNYRGLEAGYYRIAVRMHADNERMITWLRQL